MDEFEFRPLSQGLGFQKSGPKKVEVSEGIKQKTAEASILKPPLIPDGPPLRKRVTENQVARKKTELPAPIEAPTEKERKRIVPSPVLKRSCLSLSALTLDATFVTAITLLFTIALLQVTKVSLVEVLFSVHADIMPKIAVAVLFISLFINYLIVCRSFFNCTLGEWAFDIQLGSSEQTKSSFYPIRVAARVMLILCTGIVILPILSLIFRRDIPGDITGMHLLKRSFEI